MKEFKTLAWLWVPTFLSTVAMWLVFLTTTGDQLNKSYLVLDDVLEQRKIFSEEFNAFRLSASSILSEFHQDKENLRRMLEDLQERRSEDRRIVDAIYQDLDFVDRVALQRNRVRLDAQEENTRRINQHLDDIMKAVFDSKMVTNKLE